MSLRFQDFLHSRPQPAGIDIWCTLQHFAIITYAVDPARFAKLIPPRFTLNTIEINGQARALISVVPFVDVDFTSAAYPFPKFTMRQTNYRIYVIDNLTGQHCVWFLGTTLDSWAIFVPRTLWKLPWHPGRVQFDCEIDPATGSYTRYRMQTQSQWAPAHVELAQSAEPIELPGFPDLETGLVYLTHPLSGFYYRRDGRLGSYRVWHKQLMVQPARLISAHFGLLSRLGIASEAEQQSPYSVLIDPKNEFTIYLPPRLAE